MTPLPEHIANARLHISAERVADCKPLWFKLLDWFPVPDGMGCIDYDCAYRALILLPDGTLSVHNTSNPSEYDRVESEFPDAVYFGTLSRCRDKLSNDATAQMLRDNCPDLYEILHGWTPFKDHGAAVAAQ